MIGAYTFIVSKKGMTRLIKNKFKYGNKAFECYEMSVADYYQFIRDPDALVEKKLTECGKLPKLSKKQIHRFLLILLDTKKQDDPFTSLRKNTKRDDKKAQNTIKDFHVFVGILGRVTGLDVMSMPLAMFWKMLEDLAIISGNKEYDPMRNEKTLDSEGLRKATGGKKK